MIKSTEFEEEYIIQILPETQREKDILDTLLRMERKGESEREYWTIGNDKEVEPMDMVFDWRKTKEGENPFEKTTEKKPVEKKPAVLTWESKPTRESKPVQTKQPDINDGLTEEERRKKEYDYWTI